MEVSYNKKGDEIKKLEPLLVELKVGSLSASERVGLVIRLKEITKILPAIKEIKHPVLSPKGSKL